MNEHGYSINNDDEGSVMMDLIIIQRWRRNMKYQMNKPPSLRMNDIIVQSIFSEIVCLKLMGLVFKRILFQDCLNVWKRWVNSFVPQQKSLFHMRWLFCCWFFSFSQTIVKTKWWIWFWNDISFCVYNWHRTCLNEYNTCFQCVCLRCVKKTYQSHSFIWYNNVLFLRMGQQ